MALEAQAPGEFFMVPLAGALPGVGDEYLYANEQTLAEHPTIVEALVREHLLAIRSLYEDPSIATDLVAHYFPDAAGDAVAQKFISDRLWYANGGLAGPGLEKTLEAFSYPGDRASLVDDSALQAALAEIGESDATEF
jgi:ABC-type nitrate/sulfonate/bicarbonate transport system substrate-binding protein